MDRRRNPNSHSTPAWRQYRQTFDNFREKVRRVQILAADGQHDQAAIDCAVLDMEIAKEEYKTTGYSVSRNDRFRESSRRSSSNQSQ